MLNNKNGRSATELDGDLATRCSGSCGYQLMLYDKNRRLATTLSCNSGVWSVVGCGRELMVYGKSRRAAPAFSGYVALQCIQRRGYKSTIRNDEGQWTAMIKEDGGFGRLGSSSMFKMSFSRAEATRAISSARQLIYRWKG
jgi:hypothetical protein